MKTPVSQNTSQNSASFSNNGQTIGYDDNHAGYSGFTIKQQYPIPSWGENGLLEKLKSKNAIASAKPDIVLLMIGTNVGLCSYESRVTAPETSLKDSNILVYPNPVRPEYSGKVVLRGLTSDADVKVVTTGGQVVAGGTSVGGTFLWDCCDLYGRRVAPGVYYFMISTSTASQGVVAKVVVI